MSEFGANIKYLRTKAKLTQKQFGEKYNTDGSNISRWESGKAFPDTKAIKQITSDYGVSMDWLMGESKGTLDKLDLKEIKKALIEKELVYNGRELTQKQQDGIRAILLAAIEREETEEH